MSEAEGSEPRTVIVPRPGQRRGGDSPDLPAAERRAEPPPPLLRSGVNPLAAAAAPLLALAIRLKRQHEALDVQELRSRVVQQVKTFEGDALATQAEVPLLRAARYVLCATIDDLVLNTPWGSNSGWGGASLVSTFHKEVSGGQRFFDILDEMNRDPGRNLALLELIYLCLCLGFEGKYRVDPKGATRLVELRDSLFRTLRARRGDFERDLSPQWRGLQVTPRRLPLWVPLWAFGTGLAVLLLGCYAAFSLLLGMQSDRLAGALAALPPRGPLIFDRPAAAAPAPLQPSSISGFLAPEVAQGLVTLREDAQSLTIKLVNRGLFASGSAEVQAPLRPLLERIGEALESEPGSVLIAGHSDNVPIRTLRFPSNYELSKARAEAVGRIVVAQLSEPARVTVEGRGDAEPFATNATPEGREQNRRIEIVLMKQAGQP